MSASMKRCGLLRLFSRNSVQQIHQIYRRAGLGFSIGVEEFATAVATDRDHPPVGAIDDEIAEFRQVHALSRMKSVNCKGVVALLLARHRASQAATKNLNINHFRHLFLKIRKSANCKF